MWHTKNLAVYILRILLTTLDIVLSLVEKEDIGEGKEPLAVILERQISYSADKEGLNKFLRYLGDSLWCHELNLRHYALLLGRRVAWSRYTIIPIAKIFSHISNLLSPPEVVASIRTSNILRPLQTSYLHLHFIGISRALSLWFSTFTIETKMAAKDWQAVQ